MNQACNKRSLTHSRMPETKLMSQQKWFDLARSEKWHKSYCTTLWSLPFTTVKTTLCLILQLSWSINFDYGQIFVQRCYHVTLWLVITDWTLLLLTVTLLPAPLCLWRFVVKKLYNLAYIAHVMLCSCYVNNTEEKVGQSKAGQSMRIAVALL